MGYDLYLKRVSTEGLNEKLKYKKLNDLSYEEIEEITEDEINSFINVFEQYFSRHNIFYRYDDYFIIQQDEYESMLRFLNEQVQLMIEDVVDIEDKMILYVYKKMKAWQPDIKESTVLFEHDC